MKKTKVNKIKAGMHLINAREHKQHLLNGYVDYIRAGVSRDSIYICDTDKEDIARYKKDLAEVNERIARLERIVL